VLGCPTLGELGVVLAPHLGTSWVLRWELSLPSDVGETQEWSWDCWGEPLGDELGETLGPALGSGGSAVGRRGVDQHSVQH
jgi:hypothetical protein